MYQNGSVKIELSSPRLYIANPFRNAQNIIQILNQSKASFVLFAELCLSSYTAGDLFFENNFLQENLKALKFIINNNNFEGVYFIGMPFCLEGLIYNVAVVVQGPKILGIVPKHTIPNYKEFSEKRWFQSGKFVQNKLVDFLEQKVPFGNILFINKKFDIIFGVEICQDLWTIESPSDLLSLNGAHLIFNLSASTEHIGKSQLRKTAVLDHSRKQIGGYFYTSSGISETTTDTLFSNHKIAACLGEIIGEKDLFNQDISLLVDVFVDVIKYQRRIDTTYGDQKIGKESFFLKSYFNLKEVNNYYFEKKFHQKPFISESNLEEDLKISSAIQFFSLQSRLSKISEVEVILYMDEELNVFLTLLIVMNFFIQKKPKKQKLIIFLNSEIFLDKELFILLKKFLDKKGIEVILNNFFIKKDKNKKILCLESYNLSNIAIGQINNNNYCHEFSYNLNIGISNTFMVELILFYLRNDILEIDLDLKQIYLDKLNNFLTIDLIIDDFILYHYLKHNFSIIKIAFLIEKVFLFDKEKSLNKVKTYMSNFFKYQYKRQKIVSGPKIFEYSLSSRTELKLPIFIQRQK
ncbi:nitrilase-related carbon-nitrogen hydrolase ['Cynodon dactylon' phytoplasma]|uniref:nitrilase-related carbon-nitrogen hydrolase n=1 Tax='Cynodon dactylon' phytoplasma TaxID=295320 RepID=UPI001265BEF7|nr:nitrilase-related carbon-nitrogen hydrolase ['Cynodon dactylon' phytoplasma]KAB8121943.1 NAD+ synthetase ['Cynodon dactylon' phytoplasma]